MTGQMTPLGSWASSPGVRRSMLANRGRDTKPELALRKAVHALGLRYRVDHPLPLPGVRRRGDLVFTRTKVVCWLDGCYWHACPNHFTVARTNPEFWAVKIARTVQRDLETDRLLAQAGWLSLRFWEHENPGVAAEAIAQAVRFRRPNA